MLWFIRVTQPNGRTFILGEDLMFAKDEKKADELVALEKKAAACYPDGINWVVEKVPVQLTEVPA